MWICAIVGLAAGLISVFITHKAMPAVLNGASPMGAVLFGVKLLWQMSVLGIVIFVAREGILWVVGGDIAALICFALLCYRKEKKGWHGSI